MFAKFSIFSLILFISISTIVVSCSDAPKKAEEREKYVIPDSLMKTLTVDSVKKCQLIDAITLTGSVDFNQEKQVSVYSLVSGNLQNANVQLGDYVNAGQVLGVVKSSEMASYSNNLVVAQTNLTGAKKQLEAAKALFKSGLSSQMEVSSAQVNYDQAIAQLEMVNRVLKINGNTTNGDYILKAPISGFIVQKNVTNNSVIRADNGTNLFSISDLKNVWVQANVYESNISKIHMGADVDITTVSYPDRVFKGKIDKILNVLDPTNKVMKVRISLSNNDYALKPQMFTKVTVANKENREALCVSSSALMFDNSQYSVLIYKGKGDVEIRHVEVINAIGDKTFISSGVNEGEIVLSSNVVLIYGALNN